MKGKVLFEEVQTFKYTWFWFLIVIVSVLMFLIFGKGLYTQLITGKPWGDQPMPDTALIIVPIGMLVIMIGTFVFLHFHQLTVQIDEGTIRYKFYPYFSEFRTQEKFNVKEVFVRKCKPIEEFAGWGYRRNINGGKAFNINGSWGLQIVFNSGKKLLIGTQRPKELREAIVKLKENWQMH